MFASTARAVAVVPGAWRVSAEGAGHRAAVWVVGAGLSAGPAAALVGGRRVLEAALSAVLEEGPLALEARLIDVSEAGKFPTP